MTKTLVLLIGLALAGVAQAQIKCWTGADGKRACGDTPPPGAVVRTIKGPAASPGDAPAAAAKGRASKDGSRRAPTAAEREQELRWRRAEEKRLAANRRKTCERNQETLRTLESGKPIRRTDWKGERYIMDDAQRQQEAAKMRQAIRQNCS